MQRDKRCPKLRGVSIHAPREGSDRTCIKPRSASKCFNPRSPRGERHVHRVLMCVGHRFNPRSPRGERLNCCRVMHGLLSFQSTLPARGATQAVIFGTVPLIGFNPRSLRGERREKVTEQVAVDVVSIHAPREGSDVTGQSQRPHAQKFQSTLPARGATALKQPALLMDRFQSTLPARGATAEETSG